MGKPCSDKLILGIVGKLAEDSQYLSVESDPLFVTVRSLFEKA